MNLICQFFFWFVHPVGFDQSVLAEISSTGGHLHAAQDNMLQIVFPFFNLQGGTL